MLDDYKLSNYHLMLESSSMQIIAMIAFSGRQSSMNAFEKYVKLQGNLIGKLLNVYLPLSRFSLSRIMLNLVVPLAQFPSYLFVSFYTYSF